MNTTQHEYDSLWKELLEWQNRRIILLTTSLTVVTGVLAIGQGFGDRIPWWTVSLALLLLLSAACRLTAYAGYVNQRIGAFLQVFHDPTAALKWELRNVAFAGVARNGNLGLPNLNSILFWFYLLLGLVSAILPPLMFRGSLPRPYGPTIHGYGIDWLILISVGLLFAFSLHHMRKSQLNRNDLVELWRIVKEREGHEVKPPLATSSDSHAEPKQESGAVVAPSLPSAGTGQA